MSKHERPWGYQSRSGESGPSWELHPDTLSIRAGLARSGFGETSEALYLNSGFTYTSAEEAVSSFADETDHFLYSRFGNPTVAMFENRLAAIEGAEFCTATGSGMSAMFASVACMVQAGDHIVAAAAMFSSCYVVLNEILPKWGVTVEFVRGNDPALWAKALSKPTKIVFIETPSNPMLEVTDLRMVSDLAHRVGATVIVDNVMSSPVLQKPLQHGADVVMYSATKHIDGQGRVLGGAILGSTDYKERYLSQFIRHTGPTMSAFNAWVLVKSLETLSMRVERMNASAQKIAEFLQTQPKIKAVNYPGLPSHPDHAIVQKQMTGGGTTISFEFNGPATDLFAMMNKLAVIDISNNLADSKSLITHPASTTHRRLTPELRAELGINESVVRFSVGLEHPDDLIRDFQEALK